MKPILSILLSLVSIYALALEVPTPTTPTDLSKNEYSRVSLQWKKVAEAGKYYIEIDTTCSFRSPLLITHTTSSNTITTLNVSHLHYQTHYYWHIRSISATSDEVVSEWSKINEFTTNHPIELTFDNSAPDSEYFPNQTLRWRNHVGSTSYVLEIDTTPLFNSKAIQSINTSGSSSTSNSTEISQVVSQLYLGCMNYWRIKACNEKDTSNWSEVRYFHTLSKAVAQSPKDLNSAYTTQYLEWKFQRGLPNVILQLDTTLLFNSPMLRTMNSIASSQDYAYSQVSNMLFGTDYYWRVKCYHERDTTEWSTPLHFHTFNHCNLSLPADKANYQYTNCTLTWQWLKYINRYQVQLDTTPAFNSPICINQIEPASSSDYAYYTCSHLHFGTTYYWRVRGCHENDTTVWSEIRSFSTYRNCNLSTPVADSTTGVAPKTQLGFEYSKGISNYQIQLDTTPLFNSPLLDSHIEIATSQNNAYSTHQNLLYGTRYYRRARECQSQDTSDWSKIWTFETYYRGSCASPTTNQATNTTLKPKLGFSYRSGIPTYEMEIDTTPLFNSPLLIRQQEDCSSTTYAYILINSDLLYGTTYYRRVREKHAKDTSDWSTIWSFTTKYLSPSVYLQQPEDQLIIYYDSATTFAWDPYDNATDYLWQIAENADFSPISFQTTTSNTTTTMLLPKDKTYYWRVQAITPDGRSLWSDSRTLSTKDSSALFTLDTPVPSKPQDLLNNAYPRQQFSWSLVNGAAQYELELDTNPSFSSPLLQQLSYSSNKEIFVDHLHYGTHYYWRVRARSSESKMELSRWCAVQQFTTCSQPTLIRLNDPEHTYNYAPSQTLRWNNLCGSTSYSIEMDTTQAFNSPAYKQYTKSSYASNNESYQEIDVNNLYLGCQYYWRVRAYNDADSSEWSIPYTFFTLQSAVGTSPTNGATNTLTQLNFRWKRYDGLPNVIIELDTTKRFDSNEKQQLTSWAYYDDDAYTQVRKLLFGQTYYWHICYYHSCDTTEWSDVMSFTTRDYCTLSSPADQSSSIRTSPTLRFNYVSDVSYYQIQLDTTPLFNSPQLTDYIEWSTSSDYANHQYSDLLFATTYYWRARACHERDTTAWSDIWSFTTYERGELSSPTTQTTDLVVTPRLYWTYRDYIHTYQLQLDTTPRFDSPLLRDTIAQPSSSSYAYWKQNEDLLYGTTYFWRERDIHTIDTSKWSTVWEFTTTYQMAHPVIVAPANQTLTFDLTVTFQWQAMADANQYIFQLSDDDQFGSLLHQETLSKPSTTIVLPANSVLYWRVQAINSLGRSPWSDVWEINTTEGTSTRLYDTEKTTMTIQKILRNQQIFILRDGHYYTLFGEPIR